MDRKDKVLQILVEFAGKLYERVSGKQSSLGIFIYFFWFIEMFQSSLNVSLLQGLWGLKVFSVEVTNVGFKGI